jgi:hypothetical protein
METSQKHNDYVMTICSGLRVLFLIESEHGVSLLST